MAWYSGFPEYVPVAHKKAKAAGKLKQLMKKNPDMKPVIIEGRSIVRTWWGKAWNHNLELYADYSNRIGRGRSYVRHGAVLDLQIEPGRVMALVQGSGSKPYAIVIRIMELKKDRWSEMKKACEGKLDSLQELLNGKFPKSLEEVFTARGSGLFPSPKEIHFDCSCPDWASMCKHVAATLYGIGARLDEDPSLFFRLRNADMEELARQAVSDRTGKLLEKASKKSARIIEDSDLSAVFGIDIEEKPAAKKTKVKAKAKKSTSKTTRKKTA